MLALEKALNWFLLSSKDPQATALTVQGLLTGMVPTLMVLIGLGHLNLGQDQLTELVNGFCTLIEAVLTLVSAAMTFFGIVRKVWDSLFPRWAF